MNDTSIREKVMRVLSDALQDNLGQRLTPALGTGIATTVNQAIMEIEAEAKAHNEWTEP